MSKTLKVAGVPAVDPTLPKVSLTLNGREWHLCFDYAALALAERKLAEAGTPVNMLIAMDMRDLNITRLPFVLFAALLREHPEITFKEIGALVTMDSLPRIYIAIVDAYLASCPVFKEEKKSSDPIEEPVN